MALMLFVLSSFDWFQTHCGKELVRAVLGGKLHRLPQRPHGGEDHLAVVAPHGGGPPQGRAIEPHGGQDEGPILGWHYLSNDAASFDFYGITCLIRLIEFAALLTTFEETMC